MKTTIALIAALAATPESAEDEGRDFYARGLGDQTCEVALTMAKTGDFGPLMVGGYVGGFVTGMNATISVLGALPPNMDVADRDPLDGIILLLAVCRSDPTTQFQRALTTVITRLRKKGATQ